MQVGVSPVGVAVIGVLGVKDAQKLVLPESLRGMPGVVVARVGAVSAFFCGVASRLGVAAAAGGAWTGAAAVVGRG